LSVSNSTLFDKILIHKDSNEYIVANSYLHFLRDHPEFLKKYNILKIERLLLVVRFKLVFIVRIFQSIFNRKYSYPNHEGVKSDVLLVSHLTNGRQMLKNDDAYFGDLPEQLLGHSVSCSIALLKHTKISKQKVLTGWQDSQISKFVLSSSLDLLSEVRLYFVLRKSKKQLKSILKDLQVDRELVKNILCHHLSSGAFNSLRYAKQVAEIARKTGAKFVVTTYEGHAWERLVYYYVRKVNPNIKCFGYQHAAVFESQHAIKRPLGAMYNPDVVLTSGRIAKDILEKNKFKGSKIVCLGSPKYSKYSMVKNKSQSCLVVPEGFVSECLILFKLSLEYAKQHSEQIFIWRLHPIISFKELKKHSSIFKDMPNNIILSKDSFDDDIQKCDSVLYRGSTAVLNAISAGLKPIYYQQSVDILNIDPIYTCQVGKSTVYNQEGLALALHKGVNVKTKQSLQDFAQDFYTPLDVEAFLREIEG